MRIFTTLMILATLAACGPRVSGAVSSACMDGGRSAANPTLCNCVGQVAAQTLSGSDQRRLISFFEDPEKAQEIKRSDTQSADAFWDRYRDFTRTAQRACRR